jgi:hypothetical protein
MDWIREIDVPADFGELPFLYRDQVRIIRPNTEMIEALLQRPWFSRVWVLQEVAFAKEVVVLCGDKEVGWESFMAFKYWNVAALWVRTLPYIVNQAARKPWLQSFGTPGRGLLNLLVATRHCGATDPRDKLFAILPLLSPETELLAGRSADKQRLDNLRDAMKLGTQGQNDEERGVDNGLDTKIVSYTNTPAHVFVRRPGQ